MNTTLSHPSYARSWVDDRSDNQLLQLLPLLDAIADGDDVTTAFSRLPSLLS